MNTHTFIKEQGDWYIDFPAYLQEFNKTYLALIEDADELLELLSCGNESVTIQVDTQPFEKAVELELIAHGDDNSGGGGYYRMRNQSGKVIQQELWLCDVPLFLFGDIPERIYMKRF